MLDVGQLRLERYKNRQRTISFEHLPDRPSSTNSPREKNRLNSGVIGHKLFDRYNDSAIDEPLKYESKGGEIPDIDKIA